MSRQKVSEYFSEFCKQSKRLNNVYWGYWHSLGPKSHTRKIHKIHKDFELYKFFIRNFLCGKSRYLRCTCCLQEESPHFNLKYQQSCSGGNSIVWNEKSWENSSKFAEKFWIILTFHPYFFVLNCVDIQIIYIVYKETCLNYFWLIKYGFISFLSSSSMHQSHHLAFSKKIRGKNLASSFIIYVINITEFFKVISPGNSLST